MGYDSPTLPLPLSEKRAKYHNQKADFPPLHLVTFCQGNLHPSGMQIKYLGKKQKVQRRDFACHCAVFSFLLNC